MPRTIGVDGDRGTPWARWLLLATLLGAVASAVVVACDLELPWWWLAGLATALALAVGGGVCDMGSGLFARALLGGAPLACAGRVALTFDDGPDAVQTTRILDLLEARGHRATFFVIGSRADAQPELVRRIARDGHGVANHSYRHGWTTPFWAVDKLAHDLERATATIERLTGRPSRWFRPPIGLLSPRVVGAARRAGLELVGWTATARDGRRTAVHRATARLVRAARPGAILVLHDGVERGRRPPIVVEVLSRLLDELERRGLRSVTLDELLAKAPLRDGRRSSTAP